MAWTEQDYLRLGDFIVAARQTLGMSRSDLADAADVTLRTVADIESGQLRSRKTFSAESLTAIGRALNWSAGTWRKVLDDPNFTISTQQTHLPGLDPIGVGAVPQDDDRLLYRRPDGLSDDQWEALKAETREYIEWLISRADRQR